MSEPDPDGNLQSLLDSVFDLLALPTFGQCSGRVMAYSHLSPIACLCPSILIHEIGNIRQSDVLPCQSHG